MSESSASIFRTKALDGYSQPQDDGCCPKLASPRLLPFLCALGVLIFAAGLFAWLVRVPEYVSGSFVVVWGERAPADVAAPEELGFAVLVPSQSLPDLRSGQAVYLVRAENGVRLRASVYAFEQQPVSPQTAQRRFALPCEAMLKTGGDSVAVAFARAETSNMTGVGVADLSGGHGEAQIEVRSRRALSLFFDFGRSFKEAQN